MIGIEDGYVPIVHASTAAAREEERRLLDVALTRASEQLHCSWARSRRTNGGRRVDREPSPWLARWPGWRGPGPGASLPSTPGAVLPSYGRDSVASSSSTGKQRRATLQCICIAHRYTHCMAQFVTRLDDRIAQEIDDLIADGTVASRSEAVRKGLERLIDEHRRSRIGTEIADAYPRQPQTDEELAGLDKATPPSSKRSRGEDPSSGRDLVG